MRRVRSRHPAGRSTACRDNPADAPLAAMSLDGPPFVLLDDARATGAAPARLYRTPLATLVADDAAAIPALLDDVRAAVRGGLHVAGYLSFDSGAAFAAARRGADEISPPGGARAPAPLAWFGLFDRVERVTPSAVAALLPDPAGAVCGAPVPRLDAAAYRARVAQVQRLIDAGDIYQANLTFAAAVTLHGDALAAYARLRAQARAGYGALVWTGAQAVLSLSPELFFTLRGGQLLARPMKGTAARSGDMADDAAARAALARDPKQRAENLMIVDLIRNDLSRIAVPGTVAVPDLFRVEAFPTLYQMVTDVSAQLAPGRDAVDVLAAAFPCGSITGAPKVRAMEIIADIEREPRGLYTGSIGFLDPDGDAAFNVAIRTLVVSPGDVAQSRLPGQPFRATMGLGAGIVADSDPASEWRECLAKGGFVAAAAAQFDLLETMRLDPVDGILLLDAHLARLGASAAKLGFAFDRHAVRNLLQAAAFRSKDAGRLRLRLAPSGAVAIAVESMPRLPDVPVPVAAIPLPVPATDVRLVHKTSARDFYDDARARAGTFEVVLVGPDGFVTEGSFTNIFVERDGTLLTPPAEVGLLAGVLRGDLLARGRAVESPLRLNDLMDGFLIGNALRGLIPARLIAAGDDTASA